MGGAEEASGWARGALVVRGIAALAFGLLTLSLPGITLDVLVILWGAYVLADGLSLLASALSGATREHRPLLVLRGAAGVAAGVLTFVWPGITALVLLYVIVAWAAAIGVLELSGVARHRHAIRHAWLVALNGLLLIAVAVALVTAPVAGALAITWLIGWCAVSLGVLILMTAWRFDLQFGRPFKRSAHNDGEEAGAARHADPSRSVGTTGRH
jgi:uncharacterized membrane protein HdeD (DUF308 family)